MAKDLPPFREAAYNVIALVTALETMPTDEALATAWDNLDTDEQKGTVLALAGLFAAAMHEHHPDIPLMTVVRDMGMMLAAQPDNPDLTS